MAGNYAKSLWFILVLLIGGEFVAILVAFGLTPLEAFSTMPFSSRELFIVLAIADPFVILYLGLLATRNFQDLVATEDGILLPIRIARQMIHDTPNFIPFDGIESLRFFERKGADFLEMRFRSSVSERTPLILPVLWIPDQEEFMIAIANRVTVIHSQSPDKGKVSG